MSKNGYLKLRFINNNEKEKAKKMYNRLKNSKKNIDIYMNIYPKKGILEINVQKTLDYETLAKYEFLIEKNDSVYRVFLNDVRKNDVLFKYLFKECNIEFYHKNIEGIRFENNKNDTRYFMDSLYITDSKNNNRITYNKIGFDDMKTIFI